jgi:hypothetical protein
MDLAKSPKPFSTDSSTIIAATGMANERTLTPAITLITERDFGENR